MARLFYHKPKYAILDECTSAVSLDIERSLYQNSKKFGITIITVSLKPALAAFHDFELAFDGNKSYSIKKINHSNEKDE
jgi:ABC-type uncharacterized transport system fused permease/ATPase subunit